MHRPSLESSILAAGVLLVLGCGVGVLLVLRIVPFQLPLLIVVFGLSAGWALALLRCARLAGAHEHAAGALVKLHAQEASQRHEAQRALAASELKLREIISTMPVALFLKDPESRVLLMNKAAEQQFGFDFVMVSGSKGHAMFPADQMAIFLANDQAAFAKGQLVIQDELSYSHARHEDRQLRTFKKPVFDAVTGEPEFLICMSVDLTERKRAEQALQQSYVQLRQLVAHLETAKDEEHRRIAADIHDELGQNLMALKIDVEMLHTRAGERHPRLRRKVGRALDTLDASIRAVRSIMNELHPSTLELGLPAALEWLVGQFEARSGIAATLSVSGEQAEPMDSGQTRAVFRSVQEALLHILRDAGAMQVEVSLAISAERLSITIVDDGPGATAAREQDGVSGLRGIRERVEVFGGQMRVERRSRARGTSLSIVVPAAAAGEPNQIA